MRYARPLVAALLLSFALLLVGSQMAQGPRDRLALEMQVSRNGAQIENLERRVGTLENWHDKSSMEILQRISILETTVNRIERGLWGIMALIMAGVVGAGLRLVLKAPKASQ